MALLCFWLVGAWVGLQLVGCGRPEHRFPLAEVLWEDTDRRPFAPAPPEYVSPFAWDAADQTVFRPFSHAFTFDPGGLSWNVNALDEVPNSSWFHNRLGRQSISPARLAQAACDEPPLTADGPWWVTDAKPNGANPGFIIKDAQDRPFLLKFDDRAHGERATAADVIGSVLYWGAGYFAPCNRPVFFDKTILRIASGATAEGRGGKDVPLTWTHIEAAIDDAFVLPDGRLRASASRFLPGKPLGPFRYQGRRSQDPNDIIPHEKRRELRAGYVIASWLNHFDAREQNTFTTFIPSRHGGGHVRHYYLDFGDCLGSLWDWDGIARRIGHAYYLDIPYLVTDFVTLGLIRRPWEQVQKGPTGDVLGYFDVAHFTPDRWKPGYPNPAFAEMMEIDAAWMARILAHVRDAHLRAAIGAAQIQQPRVRQELFRILRGRRDRILRRWFRQRSALAAPNIVQHDDGAQLCMRDLAVWAGLQAPDTRPYRVRVWRRLHRRPQAVARAPLRRGPHAWQICQPLPDMGGRAHRPAYLI
ncbi:MAG: hypothetical protein ACPGUV_14320, partial [Polyangiales bacterium]